MKSVFKIAVCLLVPFVTQNVLADRAYLDDSLSPRQVYDLDLGWQPHEIMQSVQALLNDQNAPLPPVTGYLNGVEIVLDTRRFVGREVRIFLRLPTSMPGADSVGNLQLSWQNNGQFLAGSVSPGQEALLFEGIIEGPVVGGALDLRLSIDAGGAPERFNIEPVYEIEVIS